MREPGEQPEASFVLLNFCHDLEQCQDKLCLGLVAAPQLGFVLASAEMWSMTSGKKNTQRNFWLCSFTRVLIALRLFTIGTSVFCGWPP